MKSTWLAILMFSSFTISVTAAETEKFSIGGSARLRWEDHDNSDFSNASPDNTNFVASRFRLDMKFVPNNTVQVFFQPQFSKYWGQTEFVPSTATANTETNTSGTTHDTAMDVHQAHVMYIPSETLNFTVGRKELSYGDQLLVGGVGWSNIGRAFDLIQGQYKFKNGAVDLFNSKIKDTNVTAAGPGDKDFSGLYATNRISDSLQNLDAYAFWSSDASVVPTTSTEAYGVRLKSPLQAYDYRTEFTFEHVKGATATTDDHQLDFELGYTFLENSAMRASIEYFAATKNFDQLYPTGHKWLGYADLFSRRNIKGYRAGISSKISEKWTASFDYHLFQRQDSGQPAYKFSGAAYGAAGSDTDIASEADLVAGYKVQDNLSLEAGVARVTPSTYLKANGGGDSASFFYLQATALF